jgi:MFS family permease
VLALIILAVFGSLGLARFGYTSILPAMQDSLQLTNRQTGELQSWNLVGYLVTVVFAGLLAARHGPRLVISAALLLTSLGLLLTGLMPTFNGARLGRFLAGVGGAGGNVPAMGLVSAWFGGRYRGLAAGAAVAGSSIGLMVTGPLVPALLHHFGPGGWRVCWYVLAALAGVVLVACACFLRDRPESRGLAPLGAQASPLSTLPRPCRMGGAQLSTPLNWSLVYKSKILWHLAAIYFAFGISYIIYSTFFIRYLVKECGLTPGHAGWLWLKVGMVSGLSGFFWGGLSDRWGRRAALIGVFLLQGTSFLVFGLSQRLEAVYVSAGLFAVTAWSVPALMAALAGDLFGARLAPAALGLVTIIFGFGQALGPYLAGGIADITHTFSSVFVAAGVVALALGAGGSWCLKKG